jgi:hypothetical protein
MSGTGVCISDKQPPRLFSATLAGQKLPQSLSPGSYLLKTNSAMYLDNGDLCQLQGFVIARKPDNTTFIARIAEILQVQGTPEDFAQRPSAILLQSATITSFPGQPYGMPAVAVEGQWSLVKTTVSSHP